MNLAIIVLAAGKGTRMESDLAKVLHSLCGKPLIAWVLDTIRTLEPQRTVVVVGHQAEKVEAAVRERFVDSSNIEFVTQSRQLGTGHAVQQTQELLHDFNGDIIVMGGDSPLIEAATLRHLVEKRRRDGAAASMLIAQVQDPGNYGRVLLEADGSVQRIVEAKDADAEVRACKNINAGTYCFESSALWQQLARINNQNKSGEYYLTDVVGLLTEAGERVEAVVVAEREITGINTRAELGALEAQLREEGVCTDV